MTHVLHRAVNKTYPVAAKSAGIRITDETGKDYIDASGGAAVSCLGHGHPDVLAAMHKQLDTIAYAQEIPVFFKLLDTPVVSQLGVRATTADFQVRMALRIAYYDNSKIGPDEIEAYAEPMKTAAGKHAIIYSARQILPEDVEAISARYASIALPTLILWCDHDRIVPVGVGLKLKRTLPNAKFGVIRECGHMPQEEQPEETMLQIRDFLGTPAAE